mmetsp:Transcript_6669/g.19240  ORF Transcript_6669/g.19240 Transcript_6669/m.19240 type:complete len:243 (+) Transcript_6669:765-1493(+)
MGSFSSARTRRAPPSSDVLAISWALSHAKTRGSRQSHSLARKASVRPEPGTCSSFMDSSVMPGDTIPTQQFLFLSFCSEREAARALKYRTDMAFISAYSLSHEAPAFFVAVVGSSECGIGCCIFICICCFGASSSRFRMDDSSSTSCCRSGTGIPMRGNPRAASVPTTTTRSDGTTVASHSYLHSCLVSPLTSPSTPRSETTVFLLARAASTKIAFDRSLNSARGDVRASTFLRSKTSGQHP